MLPQENSYWRMDIEPIINVSTGAAIEGKIRIVGTAKYLIEYSEPRLDKLKE